MTLALTIGSKSPRINSEVHVGWCPPGTSNPVDLPLVDRSVRFRHTSARLLGLRSAILVSRQECQPAVLEFIPMSPSKLPKKEPFKGWKEVKRQARERAGQPPPTRREENPRKKPPKHKKRALEEGQEAS
jgi:hypothetical protein